MKRNYKYEKEMLHWLDGGEIEQKWGVGAWEPFDGVWMDINEDEWQYRIAEPAEKPKEERWVFVSKDEFGGPWINLEKTEFTIGKIRMEDL